MTSSASPSGEALGGAGLLRLLQLTSPSFPTGTFAYSEGLEAAVDAGWVSSEESAEAWISGQLAFALPHLEVPLFRRYYEAWTAEDFERVAYWVERQIAFREARELREEDAKVGRALQHALAALDVPFAEAFTGPITWLAAYALGASQAGAPLRAAAQAALYAWCENQALAASRLVPLGQKATQRVLGRCLALVPEVVERGLVVPDDALGRSAPGHSLACVAHETQYTRLFLS